MCLFCKSSLVPNEDGIIKCFCGVIASADAATPNKNAKLTILDENKRRIELQVNLEQLDVCYNTTNDLTKQDRARQMFKTNVNVTYDMDIMVVITLEVAKKIHKFTV